MQLSLKAGLKTIGSIFKNNFSLNKIKYTLVSFLLLRSLSAKGENMSTEFPKTLSEFGYTFNEDGILKQIDPNTGKSSDEGFEFNVFNDQSKNQQRYEALGEAITEYVYKLLEENGMHKVYVPENIPKEEATFIFLSKPQLEKPKKLLVLIHGSGMVRAGQWARSLIINHSLDHGTQLPYIKRARELGYEVLITNTNDNYRRINGAERSIPGHNSPKAHAISVWEKYVMKYDPESVGIVAHSYGGVVTMDLAKKYPEFFRKKVFAIGFTDSVHSALSCDGETLKHLKNIGRNWVTSNKPLDTPVSTERNDLPLYSAGHTKHEWTSYSCMEALFKFFEEKFTERNSKNPRMEL